MKRDDLPTCLHCGEPIKDDDALADIKPGPFHHECGFRMVAGGYNHVMRLCTCFGGTAEPDPPGFTKRQAAILCLGVFRARQSMEERLYEVAKKTCHEFGMPWTDPRTGETHEPPA